MCFLLPALLVMGVLIPLGCKHTASDANQAVPAIGSYVSQTVYLPPETIKISIALTGDIMVHSDQLASAYDRKTGTYSFAGIFDEAAPYLGAADITIANLETVLAGREKGYTGYPRFNSPEEILLSLRGAGVDVLTTANNHSMDRGVYGVLKTIEHLDEAGILHTGTFASAGSRREPLIIDIKGVKLGILSYTYGTNGLQVPRGKEYLVNLLDMRQVKQDIGFLREKGAEVIIVSPHYGIEYRRNPGAQEIQLVEELFNAGADIVAGSHTHVIQPMSIRDTKREGGLFAAYSLGNFVSGQKGRYRDTGVIVTVIIEKEIDTGSIRLDSAGYIPVWVHRYREQGRLKFRVIPVEKAIKSFELGADDRISYQDYQRLLEAWEETNTQLEGPDGPELSHI
ncbi:CapA family protein [Phosphitispora sp. TUW77]|uniref:CapA family protein n=1 Tax=Phosphitispora sp. TUW77 TaxID=3152361 RepID=UPI003AB61DBA